MSEATATVVLPRRILLHGATGSGKSTAAAAIAEKLGTALVLADEIGWLPGWVERPVGDQRAMVADAAAGDSWVFDSSYGKWRDVMIGRVDLIVGLDYPRWFSLQRLLRRTGRRVRTGETICNGNRETLAKAFARDSIIVWHFRSWRRKRDEMRSWAADADVVPTLLFRHPADLQAWIDALEPLAARTSSPGLG
ncbi:MAG: adenylate kinase [Microbacteriaceae bacterium]|nr:adenylate kinase [Microbacteriaceae bacterium]MCL2794712.1 adenylate kinase [Microbacteriaceae bacterium]